MAGIQSKKTRDECNAQRSITSEGVDKAFWVDAVVLGEGAEAVQAKHYREIVTPEEGQLAPICNRADRRRHVLSLRPAGPFLRGMVGGLARTGVPLNNIRVLRSRRRAAGCLKARSWPVAQAKTAKKYAPNATAAATKLHVAIAVADRQSRPSDDALPSTFLARASNQFGNARLRMESFRLEAIRCRPHTS